MWQCTQTAGEEEDVTLGLRAIHHRLQVICCACNFGFCGSSAGHHRGQQIVSKEGLKHWHQFWISICVFHFRELNFRSSIPLNLQSRPLSGRHVATGFLDPVLGAMMKQVCWHSRRSKAYRGLPEARMAGATVEGTAFEDVNMWQAPVSQKPPLMGT